MVNLRFCMRRAYESGATDHPQRVMKNLGINYEDCTPQSIADQWWFTGCTNVPDPLPDYLEVINTDISDFYNRTVCIKLSTAH